jgi:ectoine hydroxylase
MSTSSYWPTAEERAFFDTEGYLVVPDALSPEQVETLSATIDRRGSADGNRGDQFYNRLDILGLDDAFVQLVDNPAVLAKVSGFLGWNIWVNHTHYNVRPPDASAENYRYDWHVDGGVFSTDLQNQAPMTAIKVGFYLTDLTQPHRGQTYILPQSQPGQAHWRDQYQSLTPPPVGAVPLEVKPGSAVLFQQRTLHSHGSPNLSSITRKTIFMQWAYRWLFPVDTMTLGGLDSRVNDPIRRQLLGLDQKRPSHRLSARYYPIPGDLPLKSWLIRNVGILKMCELGPAAARELTQLLDFRV